MESKGILPKSGHLRTSEDEDYSLGMGDDEGV
jgi:hypothetical protein